MNSERNRKFLKLPQESKRVLETLSKYSASKSGMNVHLTHLNEFERLVIFEEELAEVEGTRTELQVLLQLVHLRYK